MPTKTSDPRKTGGAAIQVDRTAGKRNPADVKEIKRLNDMLKELRRQRDQQENDLEKQSSQLGKQQDLLLMVRNIVVEGVPRNPQTAATLWENLNNTLLALEGPPLAELTNERLVIHQAKHFAENGGEEAFQQLRGAVERLQGTKTP